MTFWSDIDPTAIFKRWASRFFVGGAATYNGNFYPPRGTWLSTNADGPDYLLRDSQLAVFNERGLVAILGASRSSDHQEAWAPDPIGVAGFVKNDRPASQGWALYGEVQHEEGAGWSVILEGAAKNKGADITARPYNIGVGGVYGTWMAGGSDNACGGDAINPSTAAHVILKNAHTWNTGIIVGADALTGPYGIALHMAKGHQVAWDAPDGQRGAAIRSDVVDGARKVTLLFMNDAILVVGANGSPVLNCMHVTNGVNYLYQLDAVTGQAPTLGSTGQAADVDLKLAPKGTGLVQIGPFDAASSTIKVKDSAGVVRKLKVVP